MDPTLAPRIGAALRRLRKQHDLSQKAVAERAGLNVATVTAVEKGARGTEFASYEKVAGGIGTTLDDVLIDLLKVQTLQAEPIVLIRVPSPPTVPGGPVDLNGHTRQYLSDLLRRLGPVKPPKESR
jgi:transcriptional regulator with XRE-family HTH domain